ncbi:HTH domain-containing protein [Clostridium paraputrificum]
MHYYYFLFYKRLEVSVRTIYRDMESLNILRISIFTDSGVS